MNALRLTVSLFVAAAVVLMAARARAQDDDETPIGPPPPPPPPTEEESAPLEATVPAPLPEPLPPLVQAPSSRFGSAGVALISSSAIIGVGRTTYDSSDASSVSVVVSPGFDYFVVRRFSVGFDLQVGYAQRRGYEADGRLVEVATTSFGVGPRFGVDLPLGRTVSWYPRLSFGIDSDAQQTKTVSPSTRKSSTPPTPGTSTEDSGGWVALFAPLLVHAAPHVFLGVGPSVYHKFSSGLDGGARGEPTVVAARFILGAWWGGTPDSSAAPVVATDPATAPRFGEVEQVVLTGEAGASLYSTSYSDSKASFTTFNLSPGVDYFVARHLSLGIAAALDYAKERSPSGSDASERYAFALAPRLGLDVPITASVSFYPRALVTVGVRSYELTEARERNAARQTFIAVGTFAPLLFHFASQAFVGFGPYVSHDVVSEFAAEVSTQDIRATSYGANLVVGAWL